MPNRQTVRRIDRDVRPVEYAHTVHHQWRVQTRQHNLEPKRRGAPALAGTGGLRLELVTRGMALRNRCGVRRSGTLVRRVNTCFHRPFSDCNCAVPFTVRGCCWQRNLDPNCHQRLAVRLVQIGLPNCGTTRHLPFNK